MFKLTPKQKAIKILKSQVFYWGKKGLETTQRASLEAVHIRHELIELRVSDEILEYWLEVNKEIYIEGQ